MPRIPRKTHGARPPRFRPGMKSIPARWLNAIADLANTNVGNPNPLRPDSSGRHAVYRLLYQSMAGDYVVCFAPGETTAIYVAKPYMLRRVPFDGLTRDGITYTYSTNILREADDGAATENQVVVPNYVTGDELYAVRYPRFGTGVVTEGGSPVAVFYLDMNLDGRAWAKQAS